MSYAIASLIGLTIAGLKRASKGDGLPATTWSMRTILHYVSKKLHPFYFCDNFVGHEPMLIIFGKNVAKVIGNMQRLTWLLLTVQMSYG